MAARDDLKPAEREYPMPYETIQIDHLDAVTTITLSRPPVNAVTVTLLEEVLAAFDALESRDETRCVVLTGSGTKAFSAGADLKASARTSQSSTRFRDLGRAVVDRLESFPKPVIAAIQGWCIGGGFAIGMACDVRLAASTARFRTGDAYLGVIPSWGMSLTRLTHFIGRNRALDLLILGEDLNATQAHEMGLVSRVIPEAEFVTEVARIAKRVSGGAPITFKAIKETVRAQYVHSPGAAQALETHWSEIGGKSEDMREGIAAFNEKRQPVFKGR
ncbi:short chain enoyl-CoA hydratase [Humitalea rosea]|uniref:Short chain enoyl-CoA hydratase n=1 Tax=Humitalea rosea TaxID=990373 RepID=A0A2W7IDA2_9PROT|nr:enoyl-CoA hydratase/isomerase family protein [Humitalea rosea]PZW44771.1 short chain enoyl-CoA hydratase [Humitalea rosea]